MVPAQNLKSHNISLLKKAWVQYLSKILCWVFRASKDSQKCKFNVSRCFALDNLSYIKGTVKNSRE